MQFVDIGVNLTHRRFDRDRAEVVERAREQGVAQMVLTGTSVAGSERSLLLAEEHGLASTAGVHPHDASSLDGAGLRSLEELAKRAVAVGECGLDFDRDYSPRDVQESAFRHQLELAVELGKPVFLHERAAHARFLAILDPFLERLPAAVVHCFTGSAQELDAYISRDLHVGITGWVCDERRGKHLLTLLDRVPDDRLMIETDAPFLTPRTLRPKPKGGRNEPAFLVEVAAAVADARGETMEGLAKHTTATARRFFGLPELSLIR